MLGTPTPYFATPTEALAETVSTATVSVLTEAADVSTEVVSTAVAVESIASITVGVSGEEHAANMVATNEKISNVRFILALLLVQIYTK